MLAAIKSWLQNDNDNEQQAEALTLQQACAVLMVEVMLVDQHLDASELAQFQQIVMREFALSDHEANELFTWAQSQKQQAVDLYVFTKKIRDSYDEQQRMQIIQRLWQLAYADEQLDAHEEHVIRRLNDLLHLHHSHFIRAKQAARDSLQ